MNYQKTGYQKNYYQPKRPVKSFQDLEVYQKSLAVCVAVIKRIPLALPDTKSKVPKETCPAIVMQKLQEAVLELPVLVSGAHSIRFSYPNEAIKKLEEAMLKCNLVVVYLEQYRDLGKHEIEAEFFEEQIKTLLATRGKIMRLQMSWKKFYNDKGRAGLKES